jgi:hypothetical protein
MERVRERLEPDKVKAMQRWLVMIGQTQGITPYDVRRRSGHGSSYNYGSSNHC